MLSFGVCPCYIYGSSHIVLSVFTYRTFRLSECLGDRELTNLNREETGKADGGRDVGGRNAGRATPSFYHSGR